MSLIHIIIRMDNGDLSNIETGLTDTNPDSTTSSHASSEPPQVVFIGKTIAGQKQKFKYISPRHKFKKLLFKLLKFIIFLGFISIFAYFGYRTYKEGPNFIVSLINRAPESEQSEENTKTTTLICEIDLDTNQLITYGSAKSGRRTITLKFNNGNFKHVIRETQINYNDSATANTSLNRVTEEHQKELPENQQKFKAKFERNGTTTNISHESDISALNVKTATFFDLPIDNSRIVNDYASLRRHYNKPSGKYSCFRQGAQIKE